VALEATDDTLVIGLNMCSEIGCKVLHTDVLEIVRDNMPGEVVLEEKNLSILLSKVVIPLMKKFLIQVGGHPCFGIVTIVKAKLCTGFLVECTGGFCLAYDEGM
jgi:hypothetical protein